MRRVSRCAVTLVLRGDFVDVVDDEVFPNTKVWPFGLAGGQLQGFETSLLPVIRLERTFRLFGT